MTREEFKNWLSAYLTAERCMKRFREAQANRLAEHDKEASRLYHNITVACANLREYLEERCEPKS